MSTVVESTVVVVPDTVKSPFTVTSAPSKVNAELTDELNVSKSSISTALAVILS